MDLEKQNQDYYNSSDYKLQFESSFPKDSPNTIQNSYFSRYMEKFINSNDKIDLYLRVFFFLIIQCLIVIFFVWIGFVTGISNAFIETSAAIIATLTIVSIYILVLCYSSLFLYYKTEYFYLHAITYVPCMVFYCYVISAATEKTNIYIVLFSIFLDIFSIFIYILSFKSLKFIGIILFPLVSNIILIIIFSFTFLYGNGLLITKIIAIDISAILYFIIVFFVLKENIFKVRNHFDTEDTLALVVFFDLAIFSPVAFIVFLAFVLLLLYIYIESEGNK